MGKIALYRKYRSRALSEVVGQDHITSVLAATAQSGDFSHAYLFTGQRGTGKTSVARILAHLINEIPYNDENQVLDIIEINAADKTSVEDIRELIDKANLAPMSVKYKIYIIDEVHQLSASASNALLKTLEEPPAHVVFILATTDPQKILPTILSRTQRFHFRPVSADKVAGHLRSIATKEKIDIDDEALKLLAERGGGSFRDSITLLDQLSGTSKKITVSDVEDILGMAPDAKINELIEAVNSKNSNLVTKILAEFRENGITPGVITDQLIKQLSAQAIDRPRLFELVEKLIEVPKSANPEIKLLAILAGASTSDKSIAAKVEKPVEVIAKIKAGSKKPESRVKSQEPTPLDSSASNGVKKSDSIVNDSKSSGSKDFNWEDVVAKAREIKPLIASFIEKASYDWDGSELSLYYRYRLHYDKMCDNQNRKVLTDALQAACGVVPEIKIISGQKPKSEAAKQVAAIMGGGDII